MAIMSKSKYDLDPTNYDGLRRAFIEGIVDARVDLPDDDAIGACVTEVGTYGCSGVPTLGAPVTYPDIAKMYDEYEDDILDIVADFGCLVGANDSVGTIRQNRLWAAWEDLAATFESWVQDSDGGEDEDEA